MGKLTDKVAKGVFWVLMEKFGLQAVHFVVTLVLARLLTPNDYGTVALLSIFISISNILVDCGFGKALVQKKKVTQTDMNSVFFLSVAIALFLYAVLFFAAPLVSRFYRIPELTVMIRVLAVSLIFHSINGVQNVELNRKMLFKLSFRISWARAIVSAVTGIVLACAGYGPWALVWSSLLGGTTGVIARQLVIRWRPTLTFSWQSLRELFRFGWKLSATGFLTHAYNELYGLLIGRFYTRADLAFVKKGAHVPRIIRGIGLATLSRVSFSALSKLQDDPRRLCGAMRKMIRVSMFVMLPPLAVLAVVAEPIIYLMYGHRWLPCVPYLRVACIGCAIVPFVSINTQALIARGRSDIYFKVMVVYRLLGLCLIAATIRYGVMVFYLSNVLFSSLFGAFVWSAPNRRHLGYRMRMQLEDLLPSVLLAVASGAVALLTMQIPVKPVFAFVPAALAGLATFGALAYGFRCQTLGVIAVIARPIVSRRVPALEYVFLKVEKRCGKLEEGIRK